MNGDGPGPALTAALELDEERRLKKREYQRQWVLKRKAENRQSRNAGKLRAVDVAPAVATTTTRRTTKPARKIERLFRWRHQTTHAHEQDTRAIPYR